MRATKHRTSGVRAAAALVVGLLALAVAACGSSSSSSQQSASATKPATVKFQLSWLPGGDNLEFWAGKAQGIYKKHGIDLDIVHTNDPTLSIKAAASGQVPIAIAYTGDILVSASHGAPVMSVFSLMDRSPFGVISLTKKGITKPSDLVGKTVGVTSLPIDQAEFHNMLKTGGVDAGKVKVVDPGQAGIQEVIAGKLDATSAVADYEPAVLQTHGIPNYHFMYYSQYGAPNAPFYDIVANPGWLKNNPDLMRRFIAATKESIAWTSTHVDQAADIFVKQFPDQDKKLVALIWQREHALQGTGANNQAQLAALNQFLQSHGQLAGKVNVQDVYSNAYL